MSTLHDKQTLVKMCRAWHMKNGEEDLRAFLDEKIKTQKHGWKPTSWDQWYEGWETYPEYQEWVIEKSLHKAIIRWGEPLIDWLLPE